MRSSTPGVLSGAVELSLLGPIEIIGPRGPIALGGAKQRLLVALLGLRANEVVSSAQLIDGVWGDEPPATAVKTMHGHIARVRRALEAEGLGDAIVTREPGYFLRIEPDGIDAVRFERCAELGRRALSAGDPRAAERELTSALALWRGDALADCRESETVEAAATRLDELRLGAIEDRVDAQLALGQHHAVVGDLEELLSHHPWRERLWGALMLALYRSQRQTEALRAFQRARRALVEALGVEPSAELRAIEGGILRGDPALDLLAPSSVAENIGVADAPVSRLMEWTMSAPAFIGRDAEFDELSRRWASVRAGGCSFVFIGGDPGIGKTRLAAEVAMTAIGDGARVLYGRCDEGLAVPYQPFVEALRTHVDATPNDELAAGLGQHRSELVRLLPELADRVAGLNMPLQSDAATEQYRLLEAVVAWLSALGDSSPLVLVLDDLHWAAPPTILMLRHVLRAERTHRLMVLATYRASELAERHPLKEMFDEAHVGVAIPDVTHLALDGLDAPSVAAFVEAAAGSELDDAGGRFVRTLHSETGGNPFFVSEIVSSLMESGALGGADSDGSTTWPQHVRVPPAARDVVLRRVARLSDDAQHALTIAAVIGPEFDIHVLEALAELDVEPVLSAVEEAVSARLVTESSPDRFLFAHAIIRGALYDRLSASRRLRLHARVAQAIEYVHAANLGAHLSELAYHYADAEPQKAVEYATHAANSALDRLAFEDAVNIALRGMVALERSRADEPLPAVTEFELMITLGRAQLQSGQRGRRTLLRAFELASALGDAGRQASALLAVNRGFFSRIGRTDRVLVEALERAVEAQPEGDSPELAELLAVLASELVWAEDGDRRFEMSDRAVAIARRSGDPRSLARVLLLRSMTISSPDTLVERMHVFEEVRDLAEKLGDPAISFDNAFMHSSTGWEDGDIDGINEMQETASQLAAELRQPRLEWQARFMLTARHMLEGDLVLAEERAQETLELGQRAGQDTEAFIFYNEQMLEIRRWQDRLHEFVSDFREVAGNEEYDFGFALTRYLYDGGEHDVARTAYSSIMDRIELPPRRDMLAMASLYNVAYLACRFDDLARAQDLYDALLPYEALFTSTTVAKPVGAHFLGMLAAKLGRPEVAWNHLEFAIDAHRRTSAPLLLAESQVECARVLLAVDATSARGSELLAAAQAIATERGASFVSRIASEVEASRV